ncbi:MAG: prolipoprotein diacylglyceryl transferase [Mycobacterium sp.]|nr:prolipoprotein diacylglyceryl transferase [Mycobacterium sp.]
MTTTLLAYIPSPAQGVWHLNFFGLFELPIRAYALCIITGIIAALIIGDRRWAARGGEQGVIYDIALWTVPFGLIGGRLYHLMTDWRTYFSEGGAGIAGAVRIWDGGLGIWGAVALGGVGAWIGCRRHGIPLPAFADAIAPGVILAQAIGRLGNYFNQELYGRPTDLPWGLEIYERSDGSGVVNPHLLNGVSTGQVAAVVHPTFLYELLWNVLVFALLIWVDRRYRVGHGRLFALYVAAYCVGRFCVELMRSDPATLIAGIRVNSFTSTFVFIGAVVYMMVAPKGREDPATLGGRRAEAVDDEAAERESAVPVTAVPVVVAAGGAAATALVVEEAEDTDEAEDFDEAEGTDEAEDMDAQPADLVDEAAPADGAEIADEADAVETQPDETEALAEDTGDDAADDEHAEPEAEADEAEPEVEAEGAEPEAAEAADDDAESVESSDEAEGAEEAEPTADAVDESVDESSAPAVDSAADEALEADEENADSDVEATADSAADSEAVDADDVEDDSVDAAAESEPAQADDATDGEAGAGDVTDEGADDEPVAVAAPDGDVAEKVAPARVPMWEPAAPRRRWWRRQG